MCNGTIRDAEEFKTLIHLSSSDQTCLDCKFFFITRLFGLNFYLSIKKKRVSVSSGGYVCG